MTNLIPPDAKRAVVIEYWIRVITVWFVLIGFALIAIAVLKIPTYVLVESQLRAFSGEYEKAINDSEQFEKAQEAITEANEIAELLTNSTDTVDLSSLITILDELSGTEVVINNFKFTKTDGEISAISVKGMAATRQSLATFSEDIEQQPLFSEAELPISNLAKDRDIGFSIDITPATES